MKDIQNKPHEDVFISFKGFVLVTFSFLLWLLAFGVYFSMLLCRVSQNYYCSSIALQLKSSDAKLMLNELSTCNCASKPTKYHILKYLLMGLASKLLIIHLTHLTRNQDQK